MGAVDIVELTLIIQLIGGMVLVASITVWSCCGVQAVGDKGVNDNVFKPDTANTGSCKAGSNVEGYGLYRYTLRPRMVLWVRQMLTTALLLVSVYTFIRNHSVGTDVSLEQEGLGSNGSSKLVLYYASHVLFIIALVLALFLDNLSNLDKKRIQRAWLPIYMLIFVQCVAVFFCTGTATALVQMLLSVGVVTFATLCAFVDIAYPQINPPTPEYTCGLLQSLSFSHINENVIIPGMKKESFEFDDVPKLSDADSSHEVWKRFRTILLSSKELNLWIALYELVKWEWIAQGCFQFLGSASSYITPLALERILLHIGNHGRDDDAVEALIPISIELAVVLLFLGPLLACIGDGQNYVRGRHIGIRVKGALIAAIYNKALSVDLTASKEGVGKLNNLMSVDVSDIQVFCCYSHMVWSTMVEILISSSLLYVVLGSAAFGGLVVMIVSLGIGLTVSKVVEHYQGQLLKCKDARMGIVSEVLNSMRVIKYYAWERKFTHKINAARRAEVGQLRQYAVTNVVLYTFWEIVPAVVGATAFVLHTYFLGRPLTPATGFTALTLFNLLRFPLDAFPEMLNFLVRTKVSIRRIEAFLRTPDVKGITDACADGRGELFPSSKRYLDHEFAPRMFPEYKLPTNTLPQPRSILERDVVESTSEPKYVGTVVLDSLTLAWSPTLRETDDDDEPGNRWLQCSDGSVARQACFCLSRAQSEPSMPLSPAKATGALVGKNAHGGKYQPISADEENAQHSGVRGSGHTHNSIGGTSGDGDRLGERGAGSPRSGNGSPRATSVPGPTRPERARSSSGVLLPEDGQTGRTVVLENTSFTIPKGSLAVVVGVTGSGKSSLLQAALLGEGLHLAGTAAVGGRVSYASQSAWIQNATLRDNVLFGTPYDKERYDKVVYSCALLSDFKLLAAGDMTEIGEKGVNLSGGQQQRVSLARAAYAYSDVILLDDPLSAVDAVVGEHIFKELVLGFLKDRTRLLVTHNMSLAVGAADYVVCLDMCIAAHKQQSRGGALPRSRVLACCPPCELPQVVQQLGALHSHGQSKGSAFSLKPVGSAHAEEADLSVFLEGLMAAVAQTSGNSGGSSKPDASSAKEGRSPSLTLDTSSLIATTDHESEGPVTDASISTATDFSPLHATSGPLRSLQQHNSAETSKESVRTDTQSKLATSADSPASLSDTAGYPIGNNDTPPIDGTAATNGTGKLIDAEGKSVGRVGWQTYWFYFQACGGVRAVLGIVGGTVLVALAWLFQNISLGEWMYAMEHEGLRRSEEAFKIYALGVLLVLLTAMLRAYSQVSSNLTSARRLHDGLINAVMNAPCGWFDATPVGRIINRFSQDMSTVDSSIIHSMYGFVDRLLATTQIVAIICVSLPVLMLPLLPVVAFTWWVSKQYLHVSRELKRLESLKKSPVFVLFSETLQGLPIIRAFRAEGRFFKTCCDRIDEMNRCHIYLWISNRWLSFRMQVLGAAVAGLVGLAVVLETGSIGSTVAGIVLIYSLSFCEALTFLARAHADCQMDLNSIERIQEYSTLPAEKGLEDTDLCGGDDGDQGLELGRLLSGQRAAGADSEGGLDSSQHPLMAQAQEAGSDKSVSTAVSSSDGASLRDKWPNAGRVEFRNIVLKYHSCATPVLRDVSFTIPGKTKMGVVGRTGAGKSSLIAALFRLVEPMSGELLIDGVNVLNLPLHELRNNIAIVPQEPTLFRGSVRFNLDPFDQHSDEELWAALTSAHLAEHVRGMPSDPDAAGASTSTSTLSGEDRTTEGDRCRSDSQGQHAGWGLLSEKLVAEKGSNFSLGQRQLLCMARAILRKASVLVLDECTASVDHETDALIQETVRKELGDCTVICIAHRLHTIAYYDNVLVMDQGRVAECAPPYELIQREGSIFRQMCTTSGDFEELLACAREAHEQRSGRR